jgi:hypothetical protein
MVFFVIWGIAYIPVGIWMVARTKLANRITRPYIIAIAGSAAYTLYGVLRMISLSIVGLQTDVGIIDVLAKVLEAE